MSITFGMPSAPNNITTYLDSLFSTSLAAYRKELIDNIGSTNAVMYDLIKSDAYESCDGGTYIAEDLMYGLTPSMPYSGYDTLASTPTDGITQAIWEWRQQASPITYNMKEVIQNKHKIISLVKARIQQAEMGIKEGWSQALMWGSQPSGGSLVTPRTNIVTGALDINPLPFLVSYNTAGNDAFANTAATGAALTVGGIPEGTNAWWQNHWATSAATTYSAFVKEVLFMYNLCSLGTGGPITHILTDQVTWQNFIHAYFSIYKEPDGGNNDYPFVWKKFLNAKIVMDDKVPDIYTGVAGTEIGGVVNPGSLTYGSMYFINDKFFKIRYAPERDWEMLTDENGKTFAKPINGDSRLGHVAWMGNITINNRRKHGVLGKIARTYTT